MNRGQAFETMMLVISVIVAIAILAILLGFLSGLGGFGQSAKTVMPDLMKKVQQAGYGLEFKDKVEFQAGDVITRGEVIGQTPIQPGSLNFVCSTEQGTICAEADGSPVQLLGSPDAPGASQRYLKVNKKAAGAVAVCTGDGRLFTVCVGSTANDVSTACFTACGLA